MVLLTGSYYYHFYFLLPNVTSTLKYFIGLFDLLIICLVAFHIIKLVLFLLHIFIAVEYVYHYYLRDLEAMITGALVALRKGSISEYKFETILRFFLEEVGLGLRRATSANEYLVSPLLFYGSVSHFPLNLYLITSLYFITLSIGDRIMIYCILSLQTVFLLASVQPMVSLGNIISRPAKLLARVQIFFTGKRNVNSLTLVCTKMKLLSFYERIHSKDAFRFTLGVIGNVTNTSVFEVFLRNRFTS